MKKITFTEKLLTHRLSIDNDHKKIISFYNTLVDIKKKDESVYEFVEILNEMQKYAFHHFIEEEKFMESFSYPQLEQHRKIHRNYLKKVSMFNANFLQPQGTTPNEVLQFIEKWWCEHILFQDMDYIAYQKTIYHEKI